MKEIISNLIKDKKKFIGPIGTLKNGKRIKKIILGENPNTKVCLICSEKGASKEQEFQKFESPQQWSSFDVVLYTETITVGIDFQESHFDCFLGLYEPPSSPDLFVQSLFRARNFRSKTHYIFFRTGKTVLPQTKKKYASKDLFYPEKIAQPDYMDLYDLCKSRTQSLYRDQMGFITNYLQRLGICVQQIPT